MENIGLILGFLTIGITSGSIIMWLLFPKLSKGRQESELKKDTKINDAEGNEAEINFLDKMIARGEDLANKIYDEQIKKKEAEALSMTFKAAFRHLYTTCAEHCEQVELCKTRLDEVLKKFNISVNEN